MHSVIVAIADFEWYYNGFRNISSVILVLQMLFRHELCCCYVLDASYGCGPRSQALAWIELGRFLDEQDPVGYITQNPECTVV